MLLFMEVMVTRIQQAGEVVVPYITENPFMSEEQISKVKAGNTISLDHDVRLKIETVKDADEKEWIGVFTSSEEMHKGSAGNVQMNQSIESILRLALKWEQVNGIVINPFGKYIQMTKKMIELLINGYEYYENESLLGISYYLKEADFEQLIMNISEIMTEGSAICFDYPSVDESGILI